MRVARPRTVVLLPALFAAILAAGCNTGLLPQPPLTVSPGDAAAADPLNPVVSGDVAAGFRDHVDAVAGTTDVAAAGGDAADASGGALDRGLTDDERMQIETLQMQLDSGAITAEAFAAQVDAILGDRAPFAAFGGLEFFGSPFGQRIRGLVAGLLGLTDEQLAEVRAIFERTHSQIRALRLTALARIRLQLTDEQRTRLDRLRAERFASIRDEAPFPPGALRGRGFLPGRPGEHRGHDAIRERIRGFFERLADVLELSDEQRLAIQRIREQLRADVKAAHATARDAFLALLTDEQRALLERIEARIRGHFDHPADDESDDGRDDHD